MGKKYFFLVLGLIITTLFQVVALNLFAQKNDSTKTSIKIKDNRPNRPIFSTNNTSTDFESFMIKVSAVKTSTSLTSSTTNKSLTANNLSSSKQIENVKIYPNPSSNQLNISYNLNKEHLVTIKVLDVLGNEVLTLLSQKISSGDQINTFNIGSKVSSGLYFLKITSGSESVIKRISIL